MDVYSEIAERIIAQQETIIGPVAIEQAMHIKNLQVDWEHHKATVTAEGPTVVDKLIEQYKKLFGKISVEVSREAAEPLLSKLPEGQLPKMLA